VTTAVTGLGMVWTGLVDRLVLAPLAADTVPMVCLPARAATVRGETTLAATITAKRMTKRRFTAQTRGVTRAAEFSFAQDTSIEWKRQVTCLECPGRPVGGCWEMPYPYRRGSRSRESRTTTRSRVQRVD
jgi:hypothetical protein